MGIRTDDVWLAQLPPWCAFRELFPARGAGAASPRRREFRRRAYTELVKGAKESYPGGSDWWQFVPREAARPVFTLVESYLRCDERGGALRTNGTSERWLASAIERATGAPPVRLRNLPRAIVRMHAGANPEYCDYVPAYLKEACVQLRYGGLRAGQPVVPRAQTAQ